MKPSDFTIRPAISADISFLYSTWLKSYKHDSTFGKSLRTSAFFPNYRLVLDRILNSPDTIVSVACVPEEPNVILGYMVHEGQYLHYVYVKDSFRKLGIATALFKSAKFKFDDSNTVDFTHLTNTALPILRNRPDLNYNPILLYNREE